MMKRIQLCDVVIDPVMTGRRIQSFMEPLGLKVADISEALESSDQAIYKWLSGKAKPSMDNLYRLSVLFGARMDDLIFPYTYADMDEVTVELGGKTVGRIPGGRAFGMTRGEDEQSSPSFFVFRICAPDLCSGSALRFCRRGFPGSFTAGMCTRVIRKDLYDAACARRKSRERYLNPAGVVFTDLNSRLMKPAGGCGKIGTLKQVSGCKRPG